MNGRKEVIHAIPLDAICPNSFQPRKIFPEQQIMELAANISAVGQLQPIIVRPWVTFSTGESNDVVRYELIAGELRWRAHQQLGLPSIQAVVREVTDAEAVCQALAENLNRTDLADYEVATAVILIMDTFPTAKSIMEDLAVDRNKLYRLLSYKNLPDYVLASLEESPRLLSKRYAYQLTGLLAADNLGAAAQDALRVLWPTVVCGALPQSHLCARVTRMATQSSAVEAQDEQLLCGNTVVGRVRWSPKVVSIDLKHGMLPKGLAHTIVAEVKGALDRVPSASVVAADSSGRAHSVRESRDGAA